MRTVTLRITGAVVLLFAGLLTWNVGATTLTGAVTTSPGTSHSMIEKVLECDASKGFCLIKDAMGRWICKKFDNVPPKSNCPRM